jgi:hypothetical protein
MREPSSALSSSLSGGTRGNTRGNPAGLSSGLGAERRGFQAAPIGVRERRHLALEGAFERLAGGFRAAQEGLLGGEVGLSSAVLRAFERHLWEHARHPMGAFERQWPLEVGLSSGTHRSSGGTRGLLRAPLCGAERGFRAAVAVRRGAFERHGPLGRRHGGSCASGPGICGAFRARGGASETA